MFVVSVDGLRVANHDVSSVFQMGRGGNTRAQGEFNICCYFVVVFAGA